MNQTEEYHDDLKKKKKKKKKGKKKEKKKKKKKNGTKCDHEMRCTTTEILTALHRNIEA